jgi:hypothetical protein
MVIALFLQLKIAALLSLIVLIRIEKFGTIKTICHLLVLWTLDSLIIAIN